LDKNEIKKKVEQGYIRADLIFEIIGNPVEHVESTIKGYIEHIGTDPGIEIINKNFAKTEPTEDDPRLFSSICDVDLLAKGLQKLHWLCLNFMPASVEITEPAKITFEPRILTTSINDLLAKLHEIATLSKQSTLQNQLMLQNINVLVRNSVLICIDNNIRTTKDICKSVGIPQKELSPVFDAMIKEKKIQKKGKEYIRK